MSRFLAISFFLIAVLACVCLDRLRETAEQIRRLQAEQLHLQVLQFERTKACNGDRP